MGYRELVRLGEITARQWGIVTTRQAAEVGLSRSQLGTMQREGLLERIRHGVYRLSIDSNARFPDDLIAAWVALREQNPDYSGENSFVVSGSSALRTHGIGVTMARYPTFVANVSPDRRVSVIRDVIVRQRALSSSEITFVDWLPVLTVEAAIADTLASEAIDVATAAEAVRDAAMRSLVDSDRLAHSLEPIAVELGFDSGSSVAAAMLETVGLHDWTVAA